MKSSKPVNMILSGSAIIAVVTLAVAVLLDKMFAFPLWIVIAFPLFFGIASFGIFYYFVERFINERLKVLYRSISKGKITKDHTFRLTEDVFEEAEKATKNWAEERNVEISRLQEQEHFRREFLGNLAHELKTPVFSIQGYVLTLLEGGLEDEKVNRMFLERAAVSIDRMVHLLEDLDQITKMEVKALKLDLQNFDLRKLVREVIDSLELKARERNITLSLSKESPVTMVYADRAKISQVLVNLINNSINYGNNGGRTTIRFYQMNDLILVEISDNGPGIDEHHLPRLFERFYRVEKSRTRNEGGSGLGLAIAKHIIDSHKQNITVRSTVGLGSTFAFSLDSAKAEHEKLVTSRGVKIR